MTKFDKVIPPGSEGKVYASVDISHSKGLIQKGIEVSSNDPTRPSFNLTIKARIKTLVDFEPEEHIRFNVTKGSLRTQTLTVLPDPSVKLGSPVVSSDMISAKLAPSAAGKQTLTVELKRSDIIGTHASEVKIPVQGAIKEVTVPVVVIVRGPIQVTPTMVSFVLKTHPEEVVVTQNTTVRQSADVSAVVVENVVSGKKLKVLAEDKGWYQVMTFEKNGGQKSTDKIPYRKIGWIPVGTVKASKMAEIPQPQEVTLQASAGKAFHVLNVQSTLSSVKVEKKPPVAGSKGYQLSVKLTDASQKTKGSLRGEILVNTDSADQPQVKIPVFVNVM